MKFSVGDKVRIVKKLYGHGFNIGEEVVVETVNHADGDYDVSNGEDYWVVRGSEIEKVGETKDALDLIASLSAEVARLSKRVEALEVGKRKRYDLDELLAQYPSRKEIVEQAKADIEALKGGRRYYAVKIVNDPPFNKASCRVDFIVNREKRTVVALLKGASTGHVYAKGIAKAAPDDCFNDHIGRAIALRRALGVEVPQEYTNAPHPEGVEVGDVVRWASYMDDERTDIFRVCGVNEREGTVAFDGIGWDYLRTVRVIDDSDREVYAND